VKTTNPIPEDGAIMVVIPAEITPVNSDVDSISCTGVSSISCTTVEEVGGDFR